LSRKNFDKNFLGTARKLLCVRKDEKGAVMFLFEVEPKRRTPKGKNHEPGLQEKSVRIFTGRRAPCPGKILVKILRPPAICGGYLF